MLERIIHMSVVTIKESKGTVFVRNRFVEVCVDLTYGAWSCVDRQQGTTVFRDALFRVDKVGAIWPEPKMQISWKKHTSRTVFGEGTTLAVTFTPQEGYEPERILTVRAYPDKAFLELGWGVRNRFSYPVRIKDVELLVAIDMFKGGTLEDVRTLKSGAGAEPNLVEKGWDLACNNGAMVTFMQSGCRHTVVAGGLAYGEFARRVLLQEGQKRWIQRADKPEHLVAERVLELACWDPQGKLVPPGETYMSADTSYLDVVTPDPFEALEKYGEALRVANHADPNTYNFPTLCGWMVSQGFGGERKPINNSPGLVEQTRIARDRGFMKYAPLAVRLEPDAYCYNTQGNTQQGWWDDEHWEMYPPGMRSRVDPEHGSLQKPYETFARFCKAVRELGGIPFTYFQASMPSNDFASAHPEWMLNADISRLHVPHAHHLPLVRYDYTHPGFRTHCLKVWKRLRKAGLAGVKFDYPEAAWARDGGFHDPSFTTTSAYRELYRLCREGLGDNAYIHERILGGQTGGEGGGEAPRLDATAGVVDIQRVWGDASHFEPEMASRMGLRWYKNRNVFLYYPDGKSFYQNKKPLPTYRRRAFLTLIGFLSGRLEIGTSIGSMTAEMFHDTTRLYPIFGGTRSPRPVDMLTGKKHPEVYAYEVQEGWHQVLLVNNNKSGRKTISVPLAGDRVATGALGLDRGASWHAFDFWRQAYLGQLEGTGALGVSLRGGEVAMISLRRVEKVPQVVSTNRHIMQGMMECHDIQWDRDRKALRGAVDVIGGEPFVLSVACNGRKPKHCEGAEMRKHSNGNEIVDVIFRSETNKRMKFEVRV